MDGTTRWDRRRAPTLDGCVDWVGRDLRHRSSVASGAVSRAHQMEIIRNSAGAVSSPREKRQADQCGYGRETSREKEKNVVRRLRWWLRWPHVASVHGVRQMNRPWHWAMENSAIQSFIQCGASVSLYAFFFFWSSTYMVTQEWTGRYQAATRTSRRLHQRWTPPSFEMDCLRSLDCDRCESRSTITQTRRSNYSTIVILQIQLHRGSARPQQRSGRVSHFQFDRLAHSSPTRVTDGRTDTNIKHNCDSSQSNETSFCPLGPTTLGRRSSTHSHTRDGLVGWLVPCRSGKFMNLFRLSDYSSTVVPSTPSMLTHTHTHTHTHEIAQKLTSCYLIDMRPVGTFLT